MGGGGESTGLGSIPKKTIPVYQIVIFYCAQETRICMQGQIVIFLIPTTDQIKKIYSIHCTANYFLYNIFPDICLQWGTLSTQPKLAPQSSQSPLLQQTLGKGMNIKVKLISSFVAGLWYLFVVLHPGVSPVRNSAPIGVHPELRF